MSRSLLCVRCGEYFSTAGSLRIHLRRIHDITSPEEARIDELEKQMQIVADTLKDRNKSDRATLEALTLLQSQQDRIRGSIKPILSRLDDVGAVLSKEGSAVDQVETRFNGMHLALEARITEGEKRLIQFIDKSGELHARLQSVLDEIIKLTQENKSEQ